MYVICVFVNAKEYELMYKSSKFIPVLGTQIKLLSLFYLELFDPHQKSDPEHGKLLKKVMGPSDVKMFIGGLSHETTTQKLWDYFAAWGEGTCSTERHS